MFNIVLFEPEIPPNTGNIIRLCANSGAKLHLIEPLGFNLNEKQVRRSGLDYHDMANICTYKDYNEFLLKKVSSGRIFTVSTKANNFYHDFKYSKNDYFVFGPETRGLPLWIREHKLNESQIRVPMIQGSRSLNLSNSVGIILYEAWRQINFINGK